MSRLPSAVAAAAIALALASCGRTYPSGTGDGRGGSGGRTDPVCGDGIRDDLEACDAGADNSDERPGACRTDCTLPACGDGVIDPPEACDDGPRNSATRPDACRPGCVAAACGDGVVDAGESCDDGGGNGPPPADCRANCALPSCGDGARDEGEECDDGAENSDTAPGACRTTCTAARCGDEVLDPGETCDDGTDNSDRRPDACRKSCVPARCGDGVRDTGEACDDGTANADAPGACRTTCVLPFCGDGIVDPDEGCDQGAENSDTVPGACRTTCVPAACGDGELDPGEECDDGAANDDATPGACRRNCRRAHCGDGVRDAGEACDAGTGNSDTRADTCRTTCALPRCGDGATDTGEECDDGPANDDTAPGACRLACLAPACGDGVADPGEGCDDGNLRDRDGCSAACGIEPHLCGNGTLEAAEECDDGNVAAGDGCDARCAVEIPATCNGGTDPVIDLRTAGDSDGGNGFRLSRTNKNDAAAWSSTCGGAGPEAIHAYVVRDTGDLVVDVEVVPGESLKAVPSVLSSCGSPPTQLACLPSPTSGVFPARRTLVVPDVSPATGLVFVVIDGYSGSFGQYRLHVHVLPPIPAGGTCRTDGSTGRCSQAGGARGCADPDGDGTGVCAPEVGPGDTCDPTRTADVCRPPTWCKSTGSGGVCAPPCGNGRVDAGEECDDGNDTNGDGCSASCVEAGDTCANAYPLSLAWDPTTRSATWTSDTKRLGTGAFNASCSGSSGAYDAVASFTAPAAGTYTFEADPLDGWPAALSLRTTCDVPASEVACGTPGSAQRSPYVTRALAAGETVFAIVEGGAANNGRFTLTASRLECGDGRRVPPESCDDGNTVGGDGCNPVCIGYGESCASPAPIPSNATSWSGNLTGFIGALGPSCSEALPDAFGRFVAPVAGTYAFSSPDARSLALRDDGCTTTVACSAGSSALPVARTLAAGEAVVVHVGGSNQHDLDFTVGIHRVTCGDGRVEFPEECDDGNAVVGDGCSSGCQVDGFEVEPNDARLQATPATVGNVHRGQIAPGTDLDYWSFPATALTPYTLETFVGAVGYCAATTGSTDTRLRVYDASGHLLGDDDDSGEGFCSKLTVTPGTTGTLYVRVQYFSDQTISPPVIAPYYLSLRTP